MSRKSLAPYMSPGSVTERLHLFTAEYTAADRVSAGGGHAGEGEDIEVIEVTLDDALAMIERGEIVDAKTIMLLYHARLKGLILGLALHGRAAPQHAARRGAGRSRPAPTGRTDAAWSGTG